MPPPRRRRTPARALVSGGRAPLMKALITDLTRMYDYHACAAGIDMDTGKRVRPVQLGRLSSRLLASRGGPLDIGNVVDFGRCRPCGKPPEIEDVRFDQRGVRLL